jgi:hypothetical protein
MSVDLRRDGFVLLLLLVLVVLLGSGLVGAYHVFGYALVAFVGVMTGLGFIRRGDAATWGPPVLASTVLFGAFTGMVAYEAAAVHSAADTVLGFQRGTAFLIYGVWIPALFTMGISFSLLFDRVNGPGDPDSGDPVARGRQ